MIYVPVGHSQFQVIGQTFSPPFKHLRVKHSFIKRSDFVITILKYRRFTRIREVYSRQSHMLQPQCISLNVSAVRTLGQASFAHIKRLPVKTEIGLKKKIMISKKVLIFRARIIQLKKILNYRINKTEYNILY